MELALTNNNSEALFRLLVSFHSPSEKGNIRSSNQEAYDRSKSRLPNFHSYIRGTITTICPGRYNYLCRKSKVCGSFALEQTLFGTNCVRTNNIIAVELLQQQFSSVF